YKLSTLFPYTTLFRSVFKLIFSPDEKLGLVYLYNDGNDAPLLFNPDNGKSIFWYEFKNRNGHYLKSYNVSTQVDFSKNVIYEIRSEEHTSELQSRENL